MLAIDNLINNITNIYAKTSVQAIDMVVAMLQQHLTRKFCSHVTYDSTVYDRRSEFYKWAMQFDEFKRGFFKGENDTRALQGIYIKRMGKENAMIIVNRPYVEEGRSIRNLEIFSSVYMLGPNHKQIHDLLNKQTDPSNKIGLNQGGIFSIYTVSTNGRTCIGNNTRTIDTIFSPQKEEIVDSVKRWLKLSNLYKQYNIVYKTGLLLYGKPGTGKTSFAKAIAQYCKCNLYVIDLSASLANIRMAIENIESAVVLFEDVDCFIKTRDKEITGEEQAKLNYLLGILDGIYSRNNCIYIATTNYINRIDEAFKRPGRFNQVIEITDLDKASAIKMCEHFKVTPDILNQFTLPINPTFLQQKLLEKRIEVLLPKGATYSAETFIEKVDGEQSMACSNSAFPTSFPALEKVITL